jgi:hypothetical protein
MAWVFIRMKTLTIDRNGGGNNLKITGAVIDNLIGRVVKACGIAS